MSSGQFDPHEIWVKSNRFAKAGSISTFGRRGMRCIASLGTSGGAVSP
jgi:hypothetical protein